MNAIELNHICKSFGEFAIRDLSLTVPSGTICGLVGENGAGKSTTIKCILNLIRRDGGTIRVLGMDNLQEERSAKEAIGVVLDESTFHDTLRPTEVGQVLKHLYKSWDAPLFAQYLDKFGLPRKKTIKEFSKGMKTKLSIAAALSARPRLLILDEATAGLDPVIRDEILDILLDFIQDEEHSVFFSSHITSDIQKIADYVVLIHQGKIVFEEEKDVLLDQYGILRCGKGTEVERPDYIVRRETGVSAEYLVRDRAEAGRKYPKAVADAASLEDIMLFYIKGEAS